MQAADFAHAACRALFYGHAPRKDAPRAGWTADEQQALGTMGDSPCTWSQSRAGTPVRMWRLQPPLPDDQRPDNVSQEMQTGQLSYKRSPQEATPVSFSPFPFPHWYNGNNNCQQAAAEQDRLAHLCPPGLSVWKGRRRFDSRKTFPLPFTALDGGIVVYSSQQKEQQGFGEPSWCVDQLRSDTAVRNSQLERQRYHPGDRGIHSRKNPHVCRLLHWNQRLGKHKKAVKTREHPRG